MLNEQFKNIEMAIKNEKMLSNENKKHLRDLIWQTCCAFCKGFTNKYPNLLTKSPQIMFDAKNDVNKFFKFYDPSKHDLKDFVFFTVASSMNATLCEVNDPNVYDDLEDKRALKIMKDLMSPLERRITYQVLRFHGMESDLNKLKEDVANELQLDKNLSSVLVIGSLHAFETLYYTTLYVDIER